MKYSKFKITHFKGIKDTAIIDMQHMPQSGIFTLVGLNESGKTSILEAIQLIQKNCPREDAHKMIHIGQRGNYTGDISIYAELVLDATDEKRIEDYCSKELGFKKIKPIEKISVNRVYRFASSTFQKREDIWDVPIVGKLPRGKVEKELFETDSEKWNSAVHYIEKNLPRILFYENFLFEFPDRIYLDENNMNPEVTKTATYREVIQDVLDSFGDGRTIKEHLLDRYLSNSPEDRSSLEGCKSDMEKKLTEVIINSWNNVFKTSGDEVEVVIDQDEIGVYLQLRIKQGYVKYSIGDRSLGFRWFFSFLLFTQFRKERKDEFGETLFLLDEPASNLHPKSQQNLLSVFNQLANDCKIIYSTHSHYLIDPKGLSGTYIVQNLSINYNEEIQSTQRNTDIRVYPYRQFVSNHPDDKDHFKPILDAIDYIPSNLELTSNIVCLEGKNDYYTLKLMERVINGSNKIKFYPGAGADKYDPLFRLYLAWGRDFIGVFDADKGGRTAIKRYEKELGPDIEGRLKTLSDIDEAWEGKETEDLFSDDDKLKIIQNLFPDETYNKGKFNTSLQDLYINESNFNFSEDTLNNFNELLKGIERLLQRVQVSG